MDCVEEIFHHHQIDQLLVHILIPYAVADDLGIVPDNRFCVNKCYNMCSKRHAVIASGFYDSGIDLLGQFFMRSKAIVDSNFKPVGVLIKMGKSRSEERRVGKEGESRW